MHECVPFWNSGLFLNYLYVLAWNWKLCNSFDLLNRYYIAKCVKAGVAFFFSFSCHQKLTLPLLQRCCEPGFGMGLFWLELVNNSSIFISILPTLPLGLQAQEHSPVLCLNNNCAGSLCGQTQKAVLKLRFRTLYAACLKSARRSEPAEAAFLRLIVWEPHNVSVYIILEIKIFKYWRSIQHTSILLTVFCAIITMDSSACPYVSNLILIHGNNEKLHY